MTSRLGRLPNFSKKRHIWLNLGTNSRSLLIWVHWWMTNGYKRTNPLCGIFLPNVNLIYTRYFLFEFWILMKILNLIPPTKMLPTEIIRFSIFWLLVFKHWPVWDHIITDTGKLNNLSRIVDLMWSSGVLVTSKARMLSKLSNNLKKKHQRNMAYQF